MSGDWTTLLEGISGGVTALGGLYASIKHIIHKSKRKKEEYRQSILDQAKKEAELVKMELEAKIKALEEEFKVQKLNISKDLIHLKENYSTEIRTLGDKINDMKDQLNQQHSQLVALITHLIDNK
jgi:hypothetical protein